VSGSTAGVDPHNENALSADTCRQLVRNVINTVFGLGFALVFVATLLINHFDLFGLLQR
jgi:hypothetical protein